MALNNIPVAQNAEENLRLLRARSQLYARGKFLLGLQLVLTVAVPVIGAVLVLLVGQLKAQLAFVSLLIALLDIIVLDRLQKGIRKSAAKMQEQFDCSVLELPWDGFAVGKELDAEDIHAAVSKFRSKNAGANFRDWYPIVVGEVPLYLGRIICQRTNLWYDAKLRRLYGLAIVSSAILVLIALLLIGNAGGLTITSFVLAVLAPAAPIMIWSFREYYRQRDAADSLDYLRSEAEKLWDRAKVGHCGGEECSAASRQFQSAIYDRRCNSPLIFSWIYWALRPSLEQQMNVGAADLIQQIDPSVKGTWVPETPGT